MKRDRSIAPLAAAGLVGMAWFAALPAEAQTLRGSAASLDRQNEQARLHDFTYLRTPEQVRQFVEAGYLVPVRPTRDMDIHRVSFPYARPEARLFLERLSAQYRAACGEKLVVTSLTRPLSNQPVNASSRSVHPTGMAVDLRRSARAACRNWLESALLGLERQGLVEAIYERNPPHYHVAVFPQPYSRYVSRITGEREVVARAASAEPDVELQWVAHTVRRGETLGGLASRYGTTVARLQAENGLRGTRILVGQRLRVPVYRPAPVRVASAGASSDVEAAVASGASGDVDGAEGLIDQSLDEGGAPAPRPAAAAPRTASHRVAPGESVWGIARAYGVSESDLRAANGLSGNRILAGQELTIPGATSTVRAAVVRHTVRRGDSLWTIARRHGTTVDELRRANGIGSTRILPGQVLDVPVGR
jgi:LysM repeat protein